MSAKKKKGGKKLQLILGAFEKMRKAAISFVMSVCPSVCPLGTNRLNQRHFYEI
jgi:hypothetical protein